MSVKPAANGVKRGKTREEVHDCDGYPLRTQRAVLVRLDHPSGRNHAMGYWSREGRAVSSLPPSRPQKSHAGIPRGTSDRRVRWRYLVGAADCTIWRRS